MDVGGSSPSSPTARIVEKPLVFQGFRAALDELHNDSTGISILGVNPNGATEKAHLPHCGALL